MAICPNCEHENEEGTLFCARCGFKLETADKEVSPVKTETENVETSDTTVLNTVEAPKIPESTPQRKNTSLGDILQSLKTLAVTYWEKLKGLRHKIWFLPSVIGAAAIVVILAVILIAASGVKPNDRSPRGAAEMVLEAQTEFTTSAYKLAPLPEELLPYASEYEAIQDYFFEHTYSRVTHVEKDGDEAIVTFESYSVDWSDAEDLETPDWDNKKEAKKYLREVLKTLKKSEPEVETSEIELKKQNGHWRLANQTDIIAYKLGVY